MTEQPDQLGFDAILNAADADNKERAFAKETAHLPDTLADAIAYHRNQIAEHHAAMCEGDFETALAIRWDAHLLARKLNNGDPGILAHDVAPGYVLARETCTKPGEVPLWGQDGSFTLHAHGVEIAVTMQGMFGTGATAMTYLGFEIRALRLRQTTKATQQRAFGNFKAAQEPRQRPTFLMHKTV